jgi:hypothetical protein
MPLTSMRIKETGEIVQIEKLGPKYRVILSDGYKKTFAIPFAGASGKAYVVEFALLARAKGEASE